MLILMFSLGTIPLAVLVVSALCTGNREAATT